MTVPKNNPKANNEVQTMLITIIDLKGILILLTPELKLQAKASIVRDETSIKLETA